MTRGGSSTGSWSSEEASLSLWGSTPGTQPRSTASSNATGLGRACCHRSRPTTTPPSGSSCTRWTPGCTPGPGGSRTTSGTAWVPSSGLGLRRDSARWSGRWSPTFRSCGERTTCPDPISCRRPRRPPRSRPGAHRAKEESMPITPVGKVWMDGDLVDWGDAKVHVLSHAMHYGSGVFEGIRCYETARGSAVWHLDEHLKRLFRSAKLYHLDIPFSAEALSEAVKETIRANELSACYIRPLVFRGYGEMGVNPLNAPVNVVIAVRAWGAYIGEQGLEQGVRVKISSWRRNDQNALPAAAKATGQYINGVLAKIEAIKAGYDEAIMLNQMGYVTDGTGENVFIVRQGALLTPPTQSGCLDGITRATVMSIAGDLGYEVREENLVRTDLYNADEAFFTGTAAEITPVREVDDRVVGEGTGGPITKEIQGTFFAATKGEIEQYASWLAPVL